MILKNRLQKLEQTVKNLPQQEWLTQNEQIAKFGKTLEEMPLEALMESILPHSAENNQRMAELEKMSIKELTDFCLNR